MKTHCKQDHEFTPENTGWSSDNSRRWCRACKREACSRYRKAHLAKERNRSQQRWVTHSEQKKMAKRLRKYGLQPEAFHLLLMQQDHMCPLCGNELNLDTSVLSETVSVDHDHRTGRIRGLVHHKCNIGLGWFEQMDWDRVRYYLEASIKDAVNSI